MSNVRKIYLLNFAWAFLVVQAVMVPFYRSQGLSFEQIAVIGSVFSLCLLIFDLPTGYLADTFGRKRALVLAGLLKGMGGTMLYVWPSFYGFIVAFVLIGLGNSLFSGTDVAMLYDSANDDFNASAVLSARFQWAQMGAAISAIVGGILGSQSLDLAIAVNAVVAWASFWIALSLASFEPKRAARLSHINEFLKTCKQVMWSSRSLRPLFCQRIFLSGILLLQVAQLQILWSELKIPIGWFGILWAVHSLLSVGLSRAVVRWEARISAWSLLLATILLPTFGFLGAALTLHLGLVSLLFMLMFELERGLTSGLLGAELNRELPPSNRAFGNSVVSLGSRLLFVLSAPFVGRMVDAHGLYDVFIILGAVSLIGGVAVSLPIHFRLGVPVWQR